MKLAVFGATGGTGILVVEQALERGHQVTAMARRPEAITIRDPKLTVRKTDTTSASDLDAAVAGHDAVISTLGPNKMFMATTDVYSGASVNIVRAMERQGIKRLVAITSAGTEDADPGFFIVYRLVIKPTLQRIYDDAKIFEEAVMKTNLDWTIVRPGRITDGKKGSGYTVSPRFLPESKTLGISRADLAGFIVDEVEQGKFIRGTPTMR